MPTFEIQAPDGGTYHVEGADEQGALAALRKMAGPRGRMSDAAGVSSDATGGPVGRFMQALPGGMLGGMSQALSAGGQAAQLEMGQPVDVPGPQQTQQALEQNVTGKLPEGQGAAGAYGRSVGEFLGNPGSYVGPGGMALKAGGAVLGGLGSEAGRRLSAGTAMEPYGGLIGGVAGGVAAGKAFGPTAQKAAIPTSPELLEAGTQGGLHGGYKGAARSGLELDPAGVAQSAGQIEQYLYGKSFSAGPNGTAPKTFGALGELQQPPAVANGRAFIGPANIDAIRSKLQDIAKEVQPTQGGAMVGTKDAAAASAALERLNAYTENIPQNHILAGDAAAYSSALKEANANYGAGARLRDFDARLTKGERATDRQIAGSLDAQIKTKAGQMIDRGGRGLNEAEQNQLSLIERGGPISNSLRQLGRGGAGVVPLGMQAATAAATGGAFLPAQAVIASILYGARKGSEAITKSRANKLAEMLAQRSPEYERRAAEAAANNPGAGPNIGALARALMAAH